MTIKSVTLLGFVLVSALLIFRDPAYARELTQANNGSKGKNIKPAGADGAGLKDEKFVGGYLNAGGYFGNGYNGGYGIGYGVPPGVFPPGVIPPPGGFFPPYGFGPGYGPYPVYGYGGDYGPPAYGDVFGPGN